LAVVFLSSPDDQQRRQVNARVPENVPPGEYPLTVECAGSQAPPFTLRILAG
jgi:uncharacterized protein (TIGR03437 family)